MKRRKNKELFTEEIKETIKEKVENKRKDDEMKKRKEKLLSGWRRGRNMNKK